MDPVSAVNFAATILTVVDFSWNLVKGSYQIHQSATGTATDDARISTILDDLHTEVWRNTSCGTGGVQI